jgi:hypothetical protein
MATDVSKRSFAFIVKGQRAPEDTGNTFLPIIGTHSTLISKTRIHKHSLFVA